MISEFETWSSGAWGPPAAAEYPHFVDADGQRLSDAVFKEKLDAEDLGAVVDEDTDANGWSYGTFYAKISNKRLIGRHAPLPSDTIRRRQWRRAGDPPTPSVSSTSCGSPKLDESDWEAVSKIVRLLWTYMGKRNASDFLSVAADPTVGFRLLRQHRQAYTLALEAACHPLSPSESAEHVDLLANMARAACFACAAYGAPMHQGRLDTVSAYAGGAAAHFAGKWSAEQNSAAFVAFTRIETQDLLLGSWAERTFEPAFCLAWAHERKWLVLSVRGTVDWRAVLTDVAAHPSPICGGLAHEGMILAAKSVVQRSLPTIRQALSERPGYQMVCAGHSLGAGVAILAGLLLRNGGHLHGGELSEEDPPALRSTIAFGIAPPPLMSAELAESCQDWVVCTVRGMDFISRLQVFSVDRLVFEMTHASAAKMAVDWISRSIGLQEASGKRRFDRHFGEDKEIAEILSPPGRILHLDTQRQRFDPTTPPPAYWGTGTFYHRYLLSTRMVLDHLPKAYHVDLVNLTAAAAKEAMYGPGGDATASRLQSSTLLSFINMESMTFVSDPPMDGSSGAADDGGEGGEDDDDDWE